MDTDLPFEIRSLLQNDVDLVCVRAFTEAFG